MVTYTLTNEATLSTLSASLTVYFKIPYFIETQRFIISTFA